MARDQQMGFSHRFRLPVCVRGVAHVPARSACAWKPRSSRRRSRRLMQNWKKQIVSMAISIRSSIACVLKKNYAPGDSILEGIDWTCRGRRKEMRNRNQNARPEKNR